MWVRRSWKPLLAVTVLLVGALVWVGQDRWRDRCGAGAEELSADDVGDVLYPPDKLREQLTGEREFETYAVGPELLDHLDALEEPFGPVAAGRMFPGFMSVPTAGAADDDHVYLASGGGWIGTEYDGSLAVADVATGAGEWGVGVTGYGAGGGPVGDSFVTLGIPEDKAPEVAAYDLETGDRQSCTKLGEDTDTGYDPALGTAEVGAGDVVVAREDDGDEGLAVTRLDPATGDEDWSSTADLSSNEVVVDDAGEVVVLSAVPSSEQPEGYPYGTVVGIGALDAGDGSRAWTWPDVPAPEDGAIGVKVVGADPDAGRIYVLERQSKAGREEDVSRVVALDADGAEVWDLDLPEEYCEAGLWGDQVVTACGDPVLAAYDAATGAPRWTSASEIRIVGGVIRLGPERSADLGDGTRLLMENDGLLRVDTGTGEITTAVTEEELGTWVSGIEVVGDHLVLSTETGVFALEREGS